MSITNMTGVGDSKDKPRVLGQANGSEPVFVETTGLFEGLPKGTQAWVTGTMVQVGINRGNLIPISAEFGEPVVTKVTRIPDREPPTVASTAPWSKGEGTTGSSTENSAVVVTDTVPVESHSSNPTVEVTTEEGFDSGYVEVYEEPDESPKPYNPADYSVPKVIAYIEDHPDEAGAIIAAERAGKARKGILEEFDDPDE